MWQTLRFFLLTLYLLTLGCTAPLHATTVTMSPADNLPAAIARLQPGDTLLLKPGSYPVQLHSLFGTRWPSGTPDKPITIMAEPGAQVLVNPSATADTYNLMYIEHAQYLIFDGLIFDASHVQAARGINTIKLGEGANHITIQNTVVRNAHVPCGGAYSPEGCGYTNAIEAGGTGNIFRNNELYNHDAYGFYVSGPGNLIEGNNIHDNQGYGIHLYKSGASDVSGNIIRNNRIVHNGWNNRNPAGSCGIILSSGSGNRACGNDIRDHNGCGIQVYGYATSKAEVLRNTIRDTTGVCIDIQAGSLGTAPAKDTLVRGNICEGNAGDIVDRGQGSRVEGNGSAAAVSTAAVQDDCGGTPLSSLPLALPAPYQLRAVRLP